MGSSCTWWLSGDVVTVGGVGMLVTQMWMVVVGGGCGQQVMRVAMEIGSG